jgi:hypothetical protein
MTGIVAAGGAVVASGGMLPDPERAKPLFIGWGRSPATEGDGLKATG